MKFRVCPAEGGFRVHSSGFKVTSYEFLSLSAMAGSGFQTRNSKSAFGGPRQPSAEQARNP